MTTDWSDLVEIAGRPPVWSGVVAVNTGVLTHFWWQVWATKRMDLGFTARLLRGDNFAPVVRVVNTLLSGAVGDLVVPSLMGTGRDWGLEHKGAELDGEVGGRSKRSAVKGKLIVHVDDGRDLEGLMNAVKRFAESVGWDGRSLG